MKSGSRQLVLNKGSEKYIFRFDSGSESQLLDALVAQAGDERTDFDWFDAAVLSFKLTQSLMGEADKLLYKDMPDALRFFQDQLD
jgi:hypothetical protein